MIKRIFFDLDETLVHTMLRNPDQNCVSFILPNDFNTYYTIVRPSAIPLLEWARKQVGYDNVYILTAATFDYAKTINDLAGFGFDDKHIIGREITANHHYPTAYGGSATIPHKDLEDANNVLIDNLPPRYNETKMNLIGIYGKNYHQVRDYYGVNLNEEEFLNGIKEFIVAKNSDANK
jgi:hypothetical protein